MFALLLLYLIFKKEASIFSKDFLDGCLRGRAKELLENIMSAIANTPAIILAVPAFHKKSDSPSKSHQAAK